MEPREIAGLLIFLIFVVPTLLAVAIWSASVSSNPSDTDNLQEGIKTAAESQIPWWVGILQAITSLPAGIAAILIIAFVFFLRWVGEIQ